MNVINVFVLVGMTLVVGFLANLFFEKTKIPDILWLIAFGLLIGPVFQLIDTTYFMQFMPYLSALALLTILFEAGLNMNIYRVIREVPRGFLIAILGFALSVAAVSMFSIYVMSLSLVKSLLLGSIVGGVSSAIVIPIVSGLHLSQETSLILDLESVMTDSIVIIVALIFIQMLLQGVTAGATGLYTVIQNIISSFSISIVVGFVLGVIWLSLLKYIEKEKYYYILTFGYLFLGYSLVKGLGGSGAVSALMIGLALGNGKELGRMFKVREISSGLSERAKLFQSQIAFFVKSAFFVALGVLITFKDPRLFLYGALLGLVLLLVRYLAVKLSTIGLDTSSKEEGIMSFMTPRGLSTAVMATIPFVQYGIGGTQAFIEIAFSVIIFTSIISTLGIFYIEYTTQAADQTPDTKT